MRSKREAKRRALLELLDRIPVRAGDAALVQKPSALQARMQMEAPLPPKAPLRQPLRDK